MSYAEVIVVMLFLILCSYYDIKKKIVYSNVCIVFGMIAIIIELIWVNKEPKNLLLGLIPGILIYIISMASSEAIGRGDAFIFAVIGLILGLINTMLVFLVALIITVILSIPLLAIKRKNLKSSLPFTPFILASFTIFILF